MLSESIRVITLTIKNSVSLNPCFNGICSLSSFNKQLKEHFYGSLNPCFNGICSLRCGHVSEIQLFGKVLILVLMEYALWELEQLSKEGLIKGLNPCFNGICSLRS